MTLIEARETQKTEPQECLDHLQKLYGQQLIEWLAMICPHPPFARISLNDIGYAHTPEKDRLHFTLFDETLYTMVAIQTFAQREQTRTFWALKVNLFNPYKTVRNFEVIWSQKVKKDDKSSSNREPNIKIFPYNNEAYINTYQAGTYTVGDKRQFIYLPFQISADPLRALPTFKDCMSLGSSSVEKADKKIQSSDLINSIYKKEFGGQLAAEQIKIAIKQLQEELIRSIHISQSDPSFYIIDGGNPWWLNPWQITLPAEVTYQGRYF
ncbi:MAG: hypothetical protein M1514_02895 [Patescibacteria group bacterium]|nr:hypothetical protein [Patescibacteria group bacterium]